MINFKSVFLIGLSLCLSACNKGNDGELLRVATSAEYPPFEYLQGDKVIGFDIDLARLIGKKLGKPVEFVNMQFSSILPSLSSHQVDMALSTITITKQRAAKLAFSKPYFHEQMAVVYSEKSPVLNPNDLCGKKVAAQLGTTMAMWLDAKVKCATVVLMDNNPMAIEALKVGQFDAVVMDGTQAVIFAKKNTGLASHPIAKSADGYGIAFPKHSSWVKKVNTALKQLEEEGEIEKLKQKWLHG